MKRLSRRRAAMVAAPAPVDPRTLCAVLACGQPSTAALHGFRLCDDCYAARVQQRVS